MYKTVPDSQVKSESKCSGYRPPAIESVFTALPFSELGDRDFELLTYLLLKNEIKAGEHQAFTNISLMQAVGERGRDCVLYYNNSVAGVVQCKKHVNKFTRPSLLRELIKFALFSTLDASILPNPDSFEYIFYVSSDLNEPAITLINSYPTELYKEIQKGNIAKYIGDVTAEYESFACYRANPPITDLLSILQSIKVSSNNATDLTSRLHRHPDILNRFFRTQPVISLEGADNLMRTALADYGLRLITDDDLKDLQKRIGGVSQYNRINLGWVDFFGYSRDFFKYLQGTKFQQLMKAVAKLSLILQKELVNFIVSEIDRLVYEQITIPLLGTKRIHPFSAGLPRLYLLDRLTPSIVFGTMPKDMLTKYYPQCSMSKSDIITTVSNKLLESSERIMRGDISQIVGNPEEIDLKLKIYAHMHQGLRTIDDAKAVLSGDLKVLLPILDHIENEISNKIEKSRTIVIKDSQFLEDKTQLNRFAETLKGIEKNISKS